MQFWWRGVGRAGALVKPIESRVPAQVTYEFEDSKCECRWTNEDVELASWRRELGRTPYGLIGEAAIVLFASAKHQTPAVILFDRSDTLQSALLELGIELEESDECLLPKTTAARSFDEVH